MYLHELQVFHWAFCIQAAEIVGSNMKLSGLDSEVAPEVRIGRNLTDEAVALRAVNLVREINFATRPVGYVEDDSACGESV